MSSDPPTKEASVSKKDVAVAEQPAVVDSGAPSTPPGCGILGRYPVVAVISFAVVGICIGVGLSFWYPEDPNSKQVALTWIGLIGDLFIRALKCVILPLVFVNVILSMLDMMSAGKASSVGWKTIGLYLCTTIMAAILGILATLAIKPLYKKGLFPEAEPTMVALGCSGVDGSYMAELPDGNLACSANYTTASPEAQFVLLSSSGNALLSKGSSGPADDISLSDTIYQGVFLKIVTANIVGAFVEANFAAVVFFAIVFGIALSRVLEEKKKVAGTENPITFLVGFLKELDNVLTLVINWIIMTTPFAILSLIAKAVGAQSDLKSAFQNIGFLMLATVLAMALHIVIVYCGMFALVTRGSPFGYLRKLVPAQTMAFATASSAATIPMTIKSVLSAGVHSTIANFVVPLGATINMDGGAIYFPCACIWLAILNGIEPSAASYILLVVVATIGSVGTAPVPSASLVLIITAYNTVFNTTGTPEGFSFILAVDWLMDRLRTTVNVTGDAVVSGMVSHMCRDDLEKSSASTPVDDTVRKEVESASSTSGSAAAPEKPDSMEQVEVIEFIKKDEPELMDVAV